MVEETGAMAGEPRRPPRSATRPGLVLAYAPMAELRGADLPWGVALDEGAVVVGREPPPSGLRLPLNSVSRIHAKLTRKGDVVSVSDMGSRNGVFVRGRRVETQALAPGDDVRIGDAGFVYFADRVDRFVGSRFDGEGDAAPLHPLVACGPATRAVFEALLPMLAVPISVLALGETGTGKELVAELVHAKSGRRGALRALNCAAIPANLVESELFGFRKGAFSGAERDSPGIVRAAHEGTLFLDEIGDMPLDVQPKLLRLLEASEIAPLGAARVEKVDVRIVCATHADLDELVAARRFRADLLARIRGHVVRLPPLRERKEDLYRLTRALLARFERSDLSVGTPFMMALLAYDWPFNVRELAAVLRRAAALASKGAELGVEHLPDELLVDDDVEPSSPGATSAEARPPVPSADELREALVRHAGNVAAVARELRRDRALIHRWLRQHGLDPDTFRR